MTFPAIASRPRAARVVPLAVAGLVAAAALGVLLAVFLRQRNQDQRPQTTPTDPRLSYTGPFQNVDPGVRYVPDGRCADCHADLAASYGEHPMGRPLVPAAQPGAAAHAAPQTTSFQALGYQFLVESDGDRVRQRCTRLGPDGRPAAELVWDVDYTIGSGGRGHSYLTDRDGYLVQTPVSWYSQKKKWDLSPGFSPAMLKGRAVLHEHLICHANRAHPVEGTVNRYARPVFDGYAIGCQRCHGPGELHVASREGAEPAPAGADLTIVNPRRLERPLRDAVCEQCHLTGEARTPRRGRDL